jgi:hypothetical protein
MKSSAKGDGRIWLLAAAGAVLAVGSTLFLFHVPAGAPVPMKVEPLPGLTFRRQNEAGGADFYDPKPLFLPTEWNSRPNVLPNDTVREPGDNFRYEAKAAPEVNAASLAFPGKAEVPKRAVEAQDSWTQEAPFFGIGQTDGKIEPLPAREALIQVVAVSDGRPVFTHILPRKDASAPSVGSWQPMEFLAAIEPAGLVGPPTPVPSSNPAEIVAQFQSDLAKLLRVGQPLAPGFYRIKVGP